MSIDNRGGDENPFNGKNNVKDLTERQMTLQARLKASTRPGSKTELITFTLWLGFFEVVFLVNIPANVYDDEAVAEAKEKGIDPDTSLVYVKFKIAKPRNND
jgi:hypothetical protein